MILGYLILMFVFACVLVAVLVLAYCAGYFLAYCFHTAFNWLFGRRKS